MLNGTQSNQECNVQTFSFDFLGLLHFFDIIWCTLNMAAVEQWVRTYTSHAEGYRLRKIKVVKQVVTMPLPNAQQQV